jgi:hypothetical protein
MTARAEVMPAQFSDATTARIPWGFAELFIISQSALLALLILPGTQGFACPFACVVRAPLAAFIWHGVNSDLQPRQARSQSWVFCAGPPRRHAVSSFDAVICRRPRTAVLSVMSPLFWAPAFVRRPEHLARILWILLVCCGLNAVVGVLQVYDPQRWLPAEFSRVALPAPWGSTLVAFRRQRPGHLRPPGLFDTPGAVAGPACHAALLGLVFAVSALRSGSVWSRWHSRWRGLPPSI